MHRNTMGKRTNRNRWRLKNTADNEYTALTGIMAFQLMGGSNCLIVRYPTKGRGVATHRFAYGLYNSKYAKHFNKYVKVTTSCGVLNCVKKEHLHAIYKPSKKEADYIALYIKIDGIEDLAHKQGIPIDLLQSYLDTLAIPIS